ncbi:PAS domain S-box protein [Starkeya koreensis]|uniref:Blue-light-activated histidine kinase n=1 Tax=Ancylobacter koreensis TaxID=266121 RepID=A0ABT0DMZ4_9HYPH|nr:PAS domain S-box protein [Ancylobacter koreensis]MCK0208648.1 PAS domain S-box protein [Ancylobacter koreensis]
MSSRSSAESANGAYEAPAGTADPSAVLIGWEQTRLHDFLKAFPQAVYVTDAAGCLVFFNEVARHLWPTEPQLGTGDFARSWRLFWPDGRPMAYAQSPMAAPPAERRAGRGHELVIEVPNGSRMSVLAFSTRLLDDGGTLTGIVNLLVDMSDRAVAYEAAQRLAAIVETSADAILTKDLDGIITSWNGGAERLFGYAAEEIVGKSVSMLVLADRPDEEPNILARIRAGERIEHYETTRRRKDGSLVDISLSVSPIQDHSGRIMGASTIARDISERRRAEEQQHLLIREMDHRVKNLFSLASSIVSLSRRSATSVDDLASAVMSRLIALSQAHALTVPHTSTASTRLQQGTTLHTLMRTILSPYDECDGKPGSRVTIEGPDIDVAGGAVTGFALLFHEFATNAAKYGALSVPGGGMDIRCEDQGATFVLTWRERGGPQIARAPDGDGFGSLLARSTVRGQLGGEIEREWKPEGLFIRLVVATDRLAG